MAYFGGKLATVVQRPELTACQIEMKCPQEVGVNWRKPMADLKPARPFICISFFAVLPLWWPSLAWWLAYSSSPTMGLVGSFALTFDLYLAVLVLLAFLALLGVPPALFFRRARRPALRYAAAALILIASWIVGEFYLGRLVWRDAVSRFERRSGPLVQAITAYQSSRGRPPAALGDLVPAYLPTVPATGRGLLEYEYLVGEKARVCGGNPWVLKVSAPCHPLGFDLFLYFPLQNYPATGYGGWLERIGSWAYVHE
jgi:hypothetical protein